MTVCGMAAAAFVASQGAHAVGAAAGVAGGAVEQGELACWGPRLGAWVQGDGA